MWFLELIAPIAVSLLGKWVAKKTVTDPELAAKFNAFVVAMGNRGSMKAQVSDDVEAQKAALENPPASKE